MEQTSFSGGCRLDSTWGCGEIVFGKGAIFGQSVIQNLSQIVSDIGGENGFVGLRLILLIWQFSNGLNSFNRFQN